jgi:ABC-type nickel/cobalt efflux system permease component RcnA
VPAGLLQGGTPRLRDLVALGFSGGIVPCPAGLTVILIGLRYPDRLLFVLGLLVFFSIGLGAVLTGIGVSLVTGKALLAARAKKGAFFQEISFLRAVFPLPFLARLDRAGARVLRVLPSLSALFIAGLGAFFCASTYATGRTEIAAMLRQLADWLN